MEIDKSIGGKWNDYSTKIDDISYYLYLKNLLRNVKNKNSIFIYDQDSFVFTYYNSDYAFKTFYNKAKLELRKEKILKILKHENKKRIC